MPVKNRIQLRRGTSTQWSNSVDILAAGELGWDTNLNNVKIGDGSNLWDDLPWLVVAGVSGQIINPAAISGVSGIFFDTSVGDVDQIAGQLGWNSEAGTFDVGLTDDLKISVGQSVLFRVKNSTGSTITKGEAVYASGVLGGGQIIQVAPFVADETIPEVRFIGLMLDDLANGEDGFVAEFGHIKNVDLRTTNTVLNPNAETWAVGDILFVDDASAGGLTKVQPKNDIYVALVLADGQNGELFVRITDPGHINDLHDVNTSGLVDNNLLVWNSGADYWEPSSDLYYVDGQLGLGIASPVSKLHVDGDVVLGSGNINRGLYIYGNKTNKRTVLKNVNGDSYLTYQVGSQNLNLGGPKNQETPFLNINYYAGSAAAGSHHFYVSPSGDVEIATITSSGVGIGTSAPQTLLDVSGVITATGGNSDEWNESYDWINVSGVDGSGAANHIAYWSDSNSITYDSGNLYWDSNNNRLGIGTSSPLESIEVHGIPDADLDMFSYGADCTTFHIGRAAGTKDNPELLTGSCSLFTMEGMGYDGNIFRKSAFIGMRLDGTPTSGNIPSEINFGTNPGTLSYPATRMTIRKDGKVGIGTTNPSYTLDVAGSGNFTGNLIVGGDLTVNGTTVVANVDTMEVEDPILTLGLASGNVVTDTNLDRGLALALNSSTTAFMGWDTSENEFSLLSSGVASNASGNYAPGTYGDLHVGNLEASGGFFSGNVGIGTASPTETLEVDGNIRLSDATPGRRLQFYRGGGTAYDYTISREGNHFAISSANDGNTNRHIQFGHHNAGTWTPKVTINGYTGDVGIGTASPSYKLQVQDADMALIHSAGTSNGIRFGDTAVRMRIGREAITHDLILESLNGGIDESIRIDYGDGNVTINEAGANIDFRVEGDADSNLLITDASTSRVGIGTDSPDYKLDVLGGIRSSGNLYVANQGSNVSGIINFQNLHSTSYYQTAYIASETLGNYGSKLSIVAKRSAGGTGAAKNIITTTKDDATGYPNQNTHVTFNSDDVSLNAVIYIGHGSNGGSIQSGNSRDSLYTERGAIFAATTGNVGIGLTNPTEKLDVSGNANISGHLSASTKSFLIDHPTKPGKKLQYGSLESPYHGVRLTGRDKLKEGVCVIELPSYMKKLVREEDISIQITNYKHHKTLYVDDIDLAKNTFTVKGHRCKTLGELEFFWSFTAVRKDVPELIVEK